MSNYDDIINLPHHVSKKRPQMSMMDRAAQFAPFKALTGYDETIKETSRFTDSEVLMDNEALNILNRKLQMVLGRIDEEPEISITYFKEDGKKRGGAYVNETGVIKKIDNLNRGIILTNGKEIALDNILDIESDILVDLF